MKFYPRLSPLLLALCLIAGQFFAQSESFDWEPLPELHPGIKLAKIRATEPRKMDIFCLQIDAEHPQVAFKTTGRAEEWEANTAETLRQTTREFLLEHRGAGVEMVAAINADAFAPWPVTWNEKSLTNLRGLAVADGVVVSPPREGGASFLVYRDGRREMAVTRADMDLSGVQLAVSGFGFVLREGSVKEGGDGLAPRTGLGLCKAARSVYFMVIDGRRHDSEGATTGEVGAWLRHFGAHDGINMDGGGSSTLVLWEGGGADAGGARVVNNPVGSGLDWLEFPRLFERTAYNPTERHNGNNLGVYLLAE